MRFKEQNLMIVKDKRRKKHKIIFELIMCMKIYVMYKKILLNRCFTFTVIDLEINIHCFQVSSGFQHF